MIPECPSAFWYFVAGIAGFALGVVFGRLPGPPDTGGTKRPGEGGR